MTTLEARPIFGISVLETLTVGMYTNPLDAVRELVQNSCDAIGDAVRGGLLKEADGRIEIAVDCESRTLSVRDNGTGLPLAQARARLTNVGQSQKSLQNNIGFRGIGRLHGIAYCEQLVFRTSAAGESSGTEVAFDAKGLRALMAPTAFRDDRAEDLLYASTEIRSIASPPDQHYFEAVLRNVSPEIPQLLDFDAIQRYLSQNAPVDFGTQFHWSTKIRGWAKSNGVDLLRVPLVLRAGGHRERYVFKPYRTSYKPLREARESTKEAERIHLDDVAFYPEDDPIGLGFWIWYSKSNLLGQIGDPEAAGLRLRKHNMAVGGAARIEELLRESRFNRYFIGEVHILSADCIPNARRDGFEDTEAWEAIREKIACFLKDREREVRSAQKARSDSVGKAIQGALAAATKAEADVEAGVSSKGQRERILQSIADNRSKLAAIPASKVTSELASNLEEAQVALARAESTVDSAPFLIAQARGQLDRKQKKLLQEILEALEEALPSAMFVLARGAIMSRFGPKEETDA